MNNKILPSLKLIFKPLINYHGEWELGDNLRNLSLKNKDKNLFDEFLERYYYMPLNVIFKDEQLTRSFKFSISSRLGESGRNLYFSKKAFLRNVVSNADEVVLLGGDAIYKEVKKAIRDRKDVYRDVDKLGKESQYYKEIKTEYKNSNTEMTFEEYVNLCKKKYTRLLTGYNAVLDFFDKPINVDKFISCFEPNELHLFACYSMFLSIKENYELYNKLDYNTVVLDSYRDLVNDIRKTDSMYNSHIIIDNNRIYTIDDLFNDYDELLNNVKNS